MNQNESPKTPEEEAGGEAVSGEEQAAAAENTEEVMPEGDDMPGEPEEASDSPEARIAELENELANAKDQQLRALAEVENMRRRSQREREDSAKYGAVGLARDLLNIADNLQRALAAAPDAGDDDSLKGLVEGISMVEKELSTVLEKHHVRPVPGVGEPFDHNLHQAVVETPTSEIEPGHIAQVLQTGYQLHDRLLRASMVAVAKAAD